MKRQQLDNVARIIKELLHAVGEDVERDGIKDTPRRVAKMYLEMLSGYGMSAESILGKKFDIEHYNEMIILKDIPFNSLCEHHTLLFSGFVTIGYIPTSQVVGISKLARLVDMYAHRLQIQERLTVEISDAIDLYLKPQGCGVVVEAVHECMRCRGVKKSATMLTSALRGVFMESPETRREFLGFVQKGV